MDRAVLPEQIITPRPSLVQGKHRRPSYLDGVFRRRLNIEHRHRLIHLRCDHDRSTVVHEQKLANLFQAWISDVGHAIERDLLERVYRRFAVNAREN